MGFLEKLKTLMNREEDLSDEERERRRLEELSKLSFTCFSLQKIGVIPEKAEVTIRLDMNLRQMFLNYGKGVSVRLPLERIRGFSSQPKIYTKNPLLGLVGFRRAVWVYTLSFQNKYREEDSLSFCGREFELDPGQELKVSKEAEKFEKAINALVFENNDDYSLL